MQPVPCLAEWMAEGPYASFLLERRFASGAPAKLVLLQPPAGHYPTPASGDLQVQLCVGGSARLGIDLGEGRFRFDFVPGAFFVAPAGHANCVDSDERCSVMFACVPWQEAERHIAEASEGRLRDLQTLHRSGYSERGVREIVHLLWRAAHEGSPASRLYADGLTQALLAALVRIALPERPAARATALPAWRLKRAQAMLADRLETEVELAEVAAAVGLSPYHFARGFKAATGMPPHAWRNARRIAHAQHLLASTRLRISEVASACGFCSQAHFTTAFRRATGATPGAWRQMRAA